MIDIFKLKNIVLNEFADIIGSVNVSDFNQMRILLQEDSFVEIWFSPRNNGRYSYHWERQQIDGTIYRHDNTPHLRWKNVLTFPKHFHDGSENNVVESHINDKAEEALRELLVFVKEKLK